MTARHGLPYPVHLYAGCPCFECDQPTQTINGHRFVVRMSLCPACGDKRCPGAISHSRHQDAS